MGTEAQAISERAAQGIVLQSADLRQAEQLSR